MVECSKGSTQNRSRKLAKLIFLVKKNKIMENIRKVFAKTKDITAAISKKLG